MRFSTNRLFAFMLYENVRKTYNFLKLEWLNREERPMTYSLEYRLVSWCAESQVAGHGPLTAQSQMSNNFTLSANCSCACALSSWREKLVVTSQSQGQWLYLLYTECNVSPGTSYCKYLFCFIPNKINHTQISQMYTHYSKQNVTIYLLPF